MSLRPVIVVAAAVMSVAFAASAQGQSLRPQVGEPLQQAADLLRAGKTQAAFAKIRQAEQVRNPTAAEQLTIARMKGSVAQRSGDHAVVVEAFEAVFAGAPADEQRRLAEAIAYAHAQQRHWDRARQWIAKARQLGAGSPSLHELQTFVQAQSGDFAAIARASAAAVAAAEEAGKRPAEDELLRLADAQQRSGAVGEYFGTLEKLLVYYPKQDYWRAWLDQLARQPGVAGRRALDVLRLRLASGTLDTTGDVMAMAQLALQARLPEEAVKVIYQGYANGLLGHGDAAQRHQRLRDLALKDRAERRSSIEAEAQQAAGDGNGLVDVGYVYVTMGEVDKGIALIERGIVNGGLKHPQQARLRLGMAQIQSTTTKAAGLKTLRSVKGADGSAEIGRAWALLAR